MSENATGDCPCPHHMGRMGSMHMGQKGQVQVGTMMCRPVGNPARGGSGSDSGSPR